MPEPSIPAELEDAVEAILEGPESGYAVGFQGLFEAWPEHRQVLIAWLAAAGVGHPLPEHRSEDRRVGRYRIEEELGRGGAGVVYRAVDEELDRHVAVKVLSPSVFATAEGRERFYREGRAVAQLDHAGIVDVYDIGEHNGLPFLTMELVTGVDLGTVVERLRSEDKQPADLDAEDWRQAVGATDDSGAPGESYARSVAAFVAEILDALEHSHQAGVTHRDIKSANVLVSIAGEPKLCDYGLAKVDGEHGLTVTGGFAGTYDYASPEQLAGKRIPVDHRADVFSMGVLLFELLTLRRPFEAESLPELHKQILLREARSPRRFNSEVPKDLEAVCLTALEKNPDDRYATAKEFAADLRRFYSGEPVHVRRRSWLAGAVRVLSRRRRGVAVVCATMVALFLASWWWQGQLQEKDNRALGLRLVAEARSVRASDPQLAFALLDRAAERLSADELRYDILAQLAATPVETRVQLEDGESAIPLEFVEDGDSGLLIGLAKQRLCAWDTKSGAIVSTAKPPKDWRAFGVIDPSDTLSAAERAMLFRSLSLQSPVDEGSNLLFDKEARTWTFGTKREAGRRVVGAKSAFVKDGFFTRERRVQLKGYAREAGEDWVLCGAVLLRIVPEKSVTAWEAATGKDLWSESFDVNRFSLSSDGRWVALASGRNNPRTLLADSHLLLNRDKHDWVRAQGQMVWLSSDMLLSVDGELDQVDIHFAHELFLRGYLWQARWSAQLAPDARLRVKGGVAIVVLGQSIECYDVGLSGMSRAGAFSNPDNCVPLLDACDEEGCVLLTDDGRLIRRSWAGSLLRAESTSTEDTFSVMQVFARLAAAPSVSGRLKDVSGAVETLPRESAWTSAPEQSRPWSAYVARRVGQHVGSNGDLWDRWSSSGSFIALASPDRGDDGDRSCLVDSGSALAIGWPSDARFVGWGSNDDSSYWTVGDESVGLELLTTVRADVRRKRVRVTGKIAKGIRSGVYDDRVLASKAASGSVQCVNLKQGKKEWSLALSGVTRLLWSHCGSKFYVVRQSDGSTLIQRLEAKTGRVQWTIEPAWRDPGVAIDGSRVSTSGPIVLCAGGELVVVDHKTGDHFMASHPSSVRSIAFAKNGRLVALACKDGKVRVLDTKRRQFTLEFDNAPHGCGLCGFSKEETHIVVLGDDGSFTFFPLDVVAEARKYARELTSEERRRFGLPERGAR